MASPFSESVPTVSTILNMVTNAVEEKVGKHSNVVTISRCPNSFWSGLSRIGCNQNQIHMEDKGCDDNDRRITLWWYTNDDVFYFVVQIGDMVWCGKARISVEL